MFLIKQNNLIAFASDSFDEINSVKSYMPFDEIIETDDIYILENGKYILQNEEYFSQKLIQAKEKKLQENKDKLNDKRYGQTFTVSLHGKDAVFDTSEQTQSDLQTAAIITSSGVLYENWVTNNGHTLNLSYEDVQLIFDGFFPLVSPLYTLDLYYKNLIENAETIEDLENIKINY